MDHLELKSNLDYEVYKCFRCDIDVWYYQKHIYEYNYDRDKLPDYKKPEYPFYFVLETDRLKYPMVMGVYSGFVSLKVEKNETLMIYKHKDVEFYQVVEEISTEDIKKYG